MGPFPDRSYDQIALGKQVSGIIGQGNLGRAFGKIMDGTGWRKAGAGGFLPGKTPTRG